MAYRSPLDPHLSKSFLDNREVFVAELDKWLQSLPKDAVDVHYEQTWEDGFVVEFVPRNPNACGICLTYLGAPEQRGSEMIHSINMVIIGGHLICGSTITLRKFFQFLTAAKEGQISVWRWRWHEEVRINVDGYVVTKFKSYIPCSRWISAPIIRAFKIEPKTITRYEPWIS